MLRRPRPEPGPAFTVPPGGPGVDAAPTPRRRRRARIRSHRHQLPPWRALALVPAALALHLLPWPPMFLRLLALIAAGALLEWRVRAGRSRWDERLYADACICAGTLWLLYATRCGLWGPAGRFSLLAFLTLWLPLAWLWWERHRIRPASVQNSPAGDVGEFEVLWRTVIAPVFDWRLSAAEPVDAGMAYRLELVPGQTIEDAEQARRKVASLLRISRRRIVFEQLPGTTPGDTDDESVIRVLVLDADNPHHQTQEWQGPSLEVATGQYRHGVYPDGDAFLALFQTEDGVPHRAVNGMWVGTTGKGKSRGLALKIAEMARSGMFCIWYADGKGGVSAPELEGFVDWYADNPKEALRMLRAAWKVMKARAKKLKAAYQEAFRGRMLIRLGSALFPFLQIILDEAQEFLRDPVASKLVKLLLRMGNEVAIGVDVATQVPLLSELGAASGDTGAEVTRSTAKAGNVVAYKTGDAFTGRISLGNGVDVDPQQLPDLKGACHINDGRGAWCRTYYLSKPRMFEVLDGIAIVVLDDASARAAGEDYATRHQRAADNNVPAEQIDLDDLDAELAILLGERLPGQPAPGAAAKTLTIKQAVFEAIKAHGGPIKRDEVEGALASMGVTASKSSIDQTLAWWVDRGHVERPSHGHYDLVTREAAEPVPAGA